MDTVDGGDRGDDLVDDLGAPSLGEVGDALDQRHGATSAAAPPRRPQARPGSGAGDRIDHAPAVRDHDAPADDHAAHEVDAEVIGQLVVALGVEHERGRSACPASRPPTSAGRRRAAAPPTSPRAAPAPA